MRRTRFPSFEMIEDRRVMFAVAQKYTVGVTSAWAGCWGNKGPREVLHQRGDPERRFAAWPKPPDAEHAQPYASRPDVPFCAASRMAMAVVLARCSVL